RRARPTRSRVCCARRTPSAIGSFCPGRLTWPGSIGAIWRVSWHAFSTRCSHVPRVGFDGRDLLRKRTGVVNNTLHLARELSASHSADVLVYVDRPRGGSDE